jgi:hypothetical protein
MRSHCSNDSFRVVTTASTLVTTPVLPKSERSTVVQILETAIALDLARSQRETNIKGCSLLGTGFK